MPARTDTASATQDFDELDNYFLDGDLDEDPFASPKQGPKETESNKRKERDDGLGIDEEISVAKKPRVPRVKLDEDRLLSEKGIPELRERARTLQLKGKHHEYGDAARLLSFYQSWLDDLFPKAKFLDALGMIEKVGHAKSMHRMRMEWINEGKPKPAAEGPDGAHDATDQSDAPATEKVPTRIAPIFEKATGASERSRTPGADDLFADEDIYNGTPPAPPRSGEAPPKDSEPEGGAPDEDDLAELMAEQEAPPPPAGETAKDETNGDGPEDNDVAELMGETETSSAPARPAEGTTWTSTTSKPDGPDFSAEEEAMAEMEGLW